MFLRVTDGFYKGEVREFPFLVAKGLLEAGRAENPFEEATPFEEPAAPPAIAPPRPGRRRSAR